VTPAATVDEEWLCEQLLRMLAAGFVPTDAYSVVEWLEKIAPRHIDRAVEVMQRLCCAARESTDGPT
jgi:hypothetical protein